MSVSLPGTQTKPAWEEMALHESDSVQDETAAWEGHACIFQAGKNTDEAHKRTYIWRPLLL